MNKRNYIVVVALIVALGGFLMGFDASVISGVVKFIEPEFNLTKLELGWSVSSLTLTATLAMMLAGPLSDKFGRKKVLSLAAILYAISAIGSAIAPSFIFLVVARMIGGLGVGASLIIAPMYIAEIAPAKMRGQMVSFNQLNIVVGISVAFFTNYLILKLGQSDASWAQSLMFDEYNWRWMLGLETIPAILYFFALFFVPKSPRWLALKGKYDEALEIMKKAVSPEEAQIQLEEVKESLSHDTTKEKLPSGLISKLLYAWNSIKPLFKPAMRLVLIIGIVVAVLQQITGINSVFFYAPMIFEQSGIGTDASFSQAILVGVINLVFTVLAILLIDKLGRKPLLSFGVAGIAICMFILAYGFSTARYTITQESISKFEDKFDATLITPLIGQTFTSDVKFKRALRSSMGEETAKQFESDVITSAITMNPILILIGILGFVASFAFSIGPVMWVLFSELFPNWIRGIAISFVGFINSAVSFIVQLLFPLELDLFGSSVTFLIYGIFAVLGFFFVIRMIPETKGKTLEELEAILVKN